MIPKLRRGLLILILIAALCIGTAAALGGPTLLMDEPPELTVASGGAQVTALRGGYSWRSAIACGVHPLDCRDITPVLPMGEDAMAALSFAVPPDEVTVSRWEGWSRSETLPVPQAVSLTDGKVPLEAGGVYLVSAEWRGAGRAEYVFTVEQEGQLVLP